MAGETYLATTEDAYCTGIHCDVYEVVSNANPTKGWGRGFRLSAT